MTPNESTPEASAEARTQMAELEYILREAPSFEVRKRAVLDCAAALFARTEAAEGRKGHANWCDYKHTDWPCNCKDLGTEAAQQDTRSPQTPTLEAIEKWLRRFNQEVEDCALADMPALIRAAAKDFAALSARPDAGTLEARALIDAVFAVIPPLAKDRTPEQTHAFLTAVKAADALAASRTEAPAQPELPGGHHGFLPGLADGEYKCVEGRLYRVEAPAAEPREPDAWGMTVDGVLQRCMLEHDRASIEQVVPAYNDAEAVPLYRAAPAAEPRTWTPERRALYEIACGAKAWTREQMIDVATAALEGAAPAAGTPLEWRKVIPQLDWLYAVLNTTRLTGTEVDDIMAGVAQSRALASEAAPRPVGPSREEAPWDSPDNYDQLEDGTLVLKDSSEVAQNDVRDILNALGLPTHARPYSPHEVVWREILPAIRALASPVGEPRPPLFDAEEIRFMDRCIQGQTIDSTYWFAMHRQIREKMFRAAGEPRPDTETA